MRREMLWGKWYTPNVRVFVHLLFWLLVTLLYYLTLSRLGGSYVKFLVIKDLFVTSSLFYSVNWIISKWVSKGKVGPLFVFFIFAYIWWVSWTYFAFTMLQDFIPTSDERVVRYMYFWIDKGYLGIFALNKFPILILDFLLMVSVPLAPKMVKVIVEDSNKMAILERDKARLETDKIRLERDNLAMELEILKSQISPHFLFNTLNNIYRMSETNDSKTSESIMRLSNMLRYLLYQTNDEEILLTNEVVFLQDYLNLAKLRLGKGVSIELDLQEIDEPYKIVPLILLPFVENAIKHGPERSRNDAWIKISLKLDDDELIYNVANGVNKKSEKPKAGGIGLQNVKRRLDLRYPDRYSLEILDEEHRHAVSLKIKL